MTRIDDATARDGRSFADEAHIALRQVRMAFGEREVFRSLGCRFPRAAMSVILGGSGSGKSTILRLIAGLVQPQAGEIVVDGEQVTELSEGGLRAVRQKIGMMFQGGALLDALTVFDNLALPLREHTRLDEREVATEVHRRLDSVGLSDVDGLLPGQLSGGMVKRVALARALMLNPVILLCDEPFSGLDPISARRIETLLVGIQRERGMTTVMVSHSVPSTMRIADHMLILFDGEVVEGSPKDIERSDDRRVRAFLHDDDVDPEPDQR
jgi:phospholipid/cholesterol/gamma-HCH transport system ATP-binding protein